MIKSILNKWPVNLSRSIMIGDQKSDYLCAKKVILNFIILKDFMKVVSKLKV